jgi:hypothetical protein
MKNKLIISAVLLLFTLASFSQTDSTTKKYRHEIGADITGLFKQFFNFNSNPNNTNYYSPTYYLSYRYHLNNSNIRFGIGGEYSKTTLGPYFLSGVEQKLYKSHSNVSLRVGYEKSSELSKKWQAFYGIDFRSTIFKYNNPNEYSNEGYLYGTTSASYIYALAPLLGFRYRISKRLSLITESSFTFNIEKYYSQRKYISIDNSIYPDRPSPKALSGTNIFSAFNQPISLLLVVDL